MHATYLGGDGVLEVEAGQLAPALRLGLVGQLEAEVQQQLRLFVRFGGGSEAAAGG